MASQLCLLTLDDVARVDPDDDRIRRYVVWRYAYDPLRRERRHQVVAAFDNEREYRALLDRLSAELARRRDAGDDVDAREHVSGACLEPGYRRRQQNGRLIARAIRHGVNINDDLLSRLELPPNVAVVRARRRSPP